MKIYFIYLIYLIYFIYLNLIYFINLIHGSRFISGSRFNRFNRISKQTKYFGVREIHTYSAIQNQNRGSYFKSQIISQSQSQSQSGLKPVINELGESIFSQNNSFLNQNNAIFGEPLSSLNLNIVPFEKVPGILWSSRGETATNLKELLSGFEKCSALDCTDQSLQQELKQVLITLQKMLDSLAGVNKKGFINYTDLSKVPVISDVYPSIFKESRLKASDYISNHNTPKSYPLIMKWSYNLYIMHLLLFSLYFSSFLRDKFPDLSSDAYQDLSTEVKTFEKELTGSLDSTIRLKLRKQGISITQNIYCGFDTEYQNIDTFKNKLLSAQLSLSTQTILKLSLKKEYTFKSTDKTLGLDIETIYKLISDGVNIYRFTKYPDHDKSIEILISGLQSDGVANKKFDDQLYFILPNTKILNYFKRTYDNKYSLKELVTTSKNLVDQDLESSLKSLTERLIKIYNKNGENVENVENTLEYIKESTPDSNTESNTESIQDSTLSNPSNPIIDILELPRETIVDNCVDKQSDSESKLTEDGFQSIVPIAVNPKSKKSNKFNESENRRT